MRIDLFRPAILVLLSVLVALASPAVAQTTVTLQEGLNSYTGTTDTDAWSGDPDANRGTQQSILLNWSTNFALIRFPIFASEGGPVPNGATISSATLSLYKSNNLDSNFQAQRLLRDWNETQATWNNAAAATPWQTPGAQGAMDVASSADGQGSVGAAPAWLDINVTSGLQAFAGGAANYGWKVTWTSGTTGAKEFVSRNNVGSPSLRPKLTVVYTTTPTACNSGASRPYTGVPASGFPIAASGITAFEAEQFNCGGEGQAYHDTVAGVNAGQTFRADNEVEIVDILAAGVGLAVNHFDTGEWLTYSINIPATGNYTFGIKASNSPSSGGSSTFRREIDGAPVAGNVTVTQGTGWEDYRWFDTTQVALSAGTHVLKLVSVLQSFRIDQVRLTGFVETGGADDCTRTGLSLCIRFETAETQFEVPGPHQITLAGVPGSPVVPSVQNKRGGGDPSPGDSANAAATDSRVGLVGFGRDGSSAFRATTRGNDDCVHSGDPSCPDAANMVWERSELQFTTAQGGVQGTEAWFASSEYFPQGLAGVPDFAMSTQDWNASLFWQFADGGGIFGLGLFNQPGPNPHIVFRAMQQGGSPSAQQYTYDVFGYNDDANTGNGIAGHCLHDQLVRNVWYDFVQHVVFSANGDGLHEIWMRENGGPVKKVLRKINISTMRNANNAIYLKLGTYHDYLPTPGGATAQASSVIHDRVRRSSLSGSAGADAVRMLDFPVDLNQTVTLCPNTQVTPGSH
jgi:hypothetical protein